MHLKFLQSNQCQFLPFYFNCHNVTYWTMCFIMQLAFNQLYAPLLAHSVEPPHNMNIMESLLFPLSYLRFSLLQFVWPLFIQLCLLFVLKLFERYLIFFLKSWFNVKPQLLLWWLLSFLLKYMRFDFHISEAQL